MIGDLDVRSSRKTRDDLEETQEPEAPALPEQVKPVGINRFGNAPERRNRFVAYVANDTKPEHALDPDFWTHIARHLTRGDIVEILPDNLAWEMSVRILDKGHNWANVRKRSYVEYDVVEVKSEAPRITRSSGSARPTCTA